jgi:tRNA (guanine37-N1)-methyltransferase
MHFSIVTLLPEMFTALDYGVVGRAIKNGTISLSFYNPRDFTTDNYHKVDDSPYGGGPGMVMMAEPLAAAIKQAKQDLQNAARVILLTPQGKQFTQPAINDLLNYEKIILVAGRYEGIDERVINSLVDEEWSIGDYILSGGEIAAMVMIDAMSRLLPGVLGDAESIVQESFCDQLVEYPQYTRPLIFDGQKVPSVLLSGNHSEIKKWRLKQMLGRTHQRRPDLLEKRGVSSEEQQLLKEFLKASSDC